MLARLLTIMALAAALALGACGSDDEGDSASPPPPPPPPPAATSTPSDSGDVVAVSIKDIKFLPHDIDVKVGQKIVWTNDDQRIPHDVTAEDPGGLFKSETLMTGDTFEYTPDKAGKIDYVCTIHSGQDGTITVTE